MNFKEWILLTEQPHLRLAQDVSITLPGLQGGSQEAVIFDYIDFRFERYLPQQQWQPWSVISPAFATCQGFQCKFPFSNQYIFFDKKQPFNAQVGNFQENLQVGPANWHQWAQFLHGQDMKIVYWRNREETSGRFGA